MNRNDIKTLLDYHIWANRQVWQCVESLSDDQYASASDYSIGSVFDQVYHLMSSDWYTIMLLQGKTPDPKDPAAPQQDALAERPSMRARWDALEQELRELSLTLTDDQWNQVVSLPTGPDTTLEAPLWSLQVANINHATNHRAQVLARIHEFGGETVEQGFFFYLISRPVTA